MANGNKSLPVPVKRDVRQKGVASTLLILFVIKDLLKELKYSEYSLHPYSPIDANCRNPAFADDVSVIALTPMNLQNLLVIV